MKSTKLFCLALMAKFIFLVMEFICELLVFRVNYKIRNECQTLFYFSV